MKIVPYNTGKVLIGCRYVPPPPPLSRDEEIIQEALLAYPIKSSPSYGGGKAPGCPSTRSRGELFQLFVERIKQRARNSLGF